MKKGIIISIIIVVIIVTALVTFYKTQKVNLPARVDLIVGRLDDVSNSGASGRASAMFISDTYTLSATFQNLPDPDGTDFYEGWIVGPSVISTGVVERNSDGIYENIYTSGNNLLTHKRYVLTLEPDDGDPAPAAHVLEGTMFVPGLD